MSDTAETPYAGLSPDAILDALEAVGFAPTGGLLELNSYENRVYQIELEDGSFVVAKFYRPGRWSDEQIDEEHAFTHELHAAELPVVAPLTRDGVSLFRHLVNDPVADPETAREFRYVVYPRQGGHPPNLEVEENLRVLARTLARIHAIGATQPFRHRPALTFERMGVESRAYLLDNQFLPPDVEPAYASTTEHLLASIGERLAGMDVHGRIHGDCHMGNLLWRGDTPHFVDFDDCVNGPPIQDLWMLLSGEREERQAQLNVIAEAYDTFYRLDPRSVALIEPLRTLRIMHHAAWIARRWHDPAFPRAFPWFESPRYWSDHVLSLREQQAALDEPLLSL